MGGPNLWVSKLRRVGGRYVGGGLTEFRDPQVGARHLATAVSAKNGRESNQKRSFKLDAAISLHRAHARCERCHSASRAIRAIRQPADASGSPVRSVGRPFRDRFTG